MYSVVEFADEDGGGVSVIRRDWLSPNKQSCLWPPKRMLSKFNKCLDGAFLADTNTWESCQIKRVFYETDSLIKAREKEKQAETESEINSDYNDDKFVRTRKKTRKIYDSETSCSNGNSSDDNIIEYPPTPPALKLASDKLISLKGDKSTGKQEHLRKQYTNVNCHTSVSDKEHELRVANKASCSTGASAHKDSTVEKKGKIQQHLRKQHTDEEHEPRADSTSSNNSVQSISCLDLTVTPILKETPNSQALDYIAKHLARIESGIKDLQMNQQEILMRVRSSTLTPLDHSLPDGITLPCDTNDVLIKIETWIGNGTENGKLLTTYLSLVGGNKVPTIIRRILEKLFTNELAASCNWTGKNNKIPLKDLQLIKIIRDAVRANQIAANATDAEIHEVISNWFRFTKDRNGGREARRANKQ